MAKGQAGLDSEAEAISRAASSGRPVLAKARAQYATLVRFLTLMLLLERLITSFQRPCAASEGRL